MLRVLYVEEEVSPLEPIKILLESTSEMTVDTADTEEGGMLKLISCRVDVILYGCQAGKGNSLEFLRALRREGCMTPVVVLCDGVSENLRSEALMIANCAYISKGNDLTREFRLLTEEIRRLSPPAER